MVYNNDIEIWQFQESEKDTAVREIISACTGIPSAKIELSADKFTKPVLLNPEAPPDFHFNVSHSRGTAVLAVSDMPVGIDIEKIRELHDVEAVIELSCTEEESRVLAGLDKDAKNRLFFKLWTRKEACVKALGADILPSAGQFQCVADDPDNPKGWVCLDRFWQDGKAFYVREPFLLDGFAAACCTPNQNADFRVVPYNPFTVRSS
jgi:phosphopantetheine--protein transferase-like protein